MITTKNDVIIGEYDRKLICSNHDISRTVFFILSDTCTKSVSYEVIINLQIPAFCLSGLSSPLFFWLVVGIT